MTLKLCLFVLFVSLWAPIEILQAQSAPPGVVALTAGRYVRIETMDSVKVAKTGALQPASDADSDSTGFRIGGCYILTNTHTISVGDAYEVDGKEVQVLSGVVPKYDLMLLNPPCDKPAPWVTIADPRQGEGIYAMTNADGVDGFFTGYMVSKVDASCLYLQLPTIYGASGSGFVNEKGQLVGFTMGDRATGNTNFPVLYSRAIPASTIRKFLRMVLPQEDLAKMGISKEDADPSPSPPATKK